MQMQIDVKNINLKMWKTCIVIAFVLTIFRVVKAFQMSDADKECCLSSFSSLSAMRYFSLLSNKDTLYQTMDLKCNNGSLHALLTSVFNVSMAINRLATNFRCVLPRDEHFFESMENDSLKMQSSIIDTKKKSLWTQ